MLSVWGLRTPLELDRRVTRAPVPPQWFREAVEAQQGVPIGLLSQLFVRLEPIYTVHSQLLRDLEQRLIAWSVQAVWSVDEIRQACS